jgi:prepilin-type N-terminal cleavage/methylation domain-containing protein
MLKRLFRSRPKISSISGFTLLEILVSMIIASIIISTLFTVLFGILQSNRREDAKQKSQEELQAAANYIANDLQQAVYIYPSEALYNTTSQKYIGNLIPKSTGTYDRTPILAFWKRYTLLDEELVRNADGSGNTKVKCIESSNPSDESSCLRRDTFVYSLVVYYLEKGGSGGNKSKSVTISRFEARDGITAPQCITDTQPRNLNCEITIEINSRRYYSLPTTVEGASIPGQVAGGSVLNNFQPFSFQSGELVWKTTNGSSLGNEGVLRLIDYLDATPYDSDQDNGSGTGLVNVLRPDSNLSPYDPDGPDGPLPQIQVNDCEHPDKGGLGYVSASKRATRIPPDFRSLPASLQTTSFYACVNSNQTVAKVFIRGNALIRLGVRNPLPTPENRAFFPEVSVIGAGRGIVVAE